MARTALLIIVCLIAATAFGQGKSRIEISQSCATSSLSGCFPGDSTGFPVTIANPGSYYLSSDLTSQSIHTNFILIESSDVTIDLNGYGILGPVECNGDTPTCTPQSTDTSADGIRAIDPNTNIVVKNGRVSGVGGSGVQLGADSGSISNIVATDNSYYGITVRGSGTIRNSTASNNGLNGILGDAGVLVIDNSAYNNYSEGAFDGVCGNNVFHSNDDSSNTPTEANCRSTISTNMCDGSAC